MNRIWKGHTAAAGHVVEGEAIVSTMPFGFFGGCNPRTGVVIDQWHDLHNQSIKGKIFVYPEGRGSTVGAAVMLELVRTQSAALAILNNHCEIISQCGCILAKKFYDVDMPMLDEFGVDITSEIKTGDWLRVDPQAGTVERLERSGGTTVPAEKEKE